MAHRELVHIDTRGDLYPLRSIQAAVLVDVNECGAYLVLYRVSGAWTGRGREK